MALQSNMWSSETLERGLNVARQATLSLEADADFAAMQVEMQASGFVLEVFGPGGILLAVFETHLQCPNLTDSMLLALI